MAVTQFDLTRLPELYASTFGKIAIARLSDIANTEGVLKQQPKGTLIAADDKPGLRTSALGTAIYMPVQINGVWLPNEPLIEMSTSNAIISEPMAAGDSDFKEFMGQNDRQFRIYGFAVNEDEIDEYPETVVRQLRSLSDAQVSMPCQSPLLQIFNINRLVIKSAKYAAGYGEYSYQPYEFDCVSDEDITLELLNVPGT